MILNYTLEDRRTLIDRRRLLSWLKSFSFILCDANANRYVPFMGMVTIWMNEIKWIKYSVIGGLGLLAILQRDE
jgi:hypothetical protein